MAETTMEPWSFTIVFDEDKAKKNGYEVDTLYDYVGKNVEGLGNERIARGTSAATAGGGIAAANGHGHSRRRCS